MPKPDEGLVREVLSRNGRGQSLRAAVLKAWDSVKALREGNPWWRRRTTTAALMWEHSVENAVHTLSDDAGAKIIPHHDTTSFVFDDAVLLRMKKANIQLISSNYPTPLAESFHDHDADLFGFAGLHRVQLCHVLNRFKTKIDWIGVVARDAGNVLWHFDLDLTQVKAIPLPLPKHGTAADDVLRPRLPDDRKSGGEGAA